MLRFLLRLRFWLFPASSEKAMAGRYKWTFPHLRDPRLPPAMQTERWLQFITNELTAVGNGWVAFASLHSHSLLDSGMPVWHETSRSPKWLKELESRVMKGEFDGRA